MKGKTTLCALLCAIAVFGGIAACAASPVADPGFPFIDVNGDGLYSAADGDIGLGSTPSIDIAALIASDGHFHTQRNKGAYRAPATNVSLVIPASQSLTLSTPLALTAGANLIVRGTLRAPDIQLTACLTADVAKANATFDTKMSVTAGVDAILSGVTITGNAGASALHVSAGRNLLGNQADGFATAILVGQAIGLKAACGAFFDGASLQTLSAATPTTPASHISVYATGVVQTRNNTSIVSVGETCIVSQCDSVCVQTLSLTAGCAALRAAADLNITDSALTTTGAVGLAAGRTLTGNSPITAITADHLYATAPCGMDLSGSALLTTAGTIGLHAPGGPITIAGASINAAGGLIVHAQQAIEASRIVVRADTAIHFCSDCSPIRLTMSKIAGILASVTTTQITVRALGSIDAGQASWSVPASICVDSRCGDITARQATLKATGTPGTVKLIAGGGNIDVTGAVLGGIVTYGPAHVHVVGP